MTSFLLDFRVTYTSVLEGEICPRKLQGRHGFFQYLDWERNRWSIECMNCNLFLIHSVVYSNLSRYPPPHTPFPHYLFFLSLQVLSCTLTFCKYFCLTNRMWLRKTLCSWLILMQLNFFSEQTRSLNSRYYLLAFLFKLFPPILMQIHLTLVQ